MDDTEKAIRAKLAEPHMARLADRVDDPSNLVLAPFRLVRVIDAERETIAALRRENERLLATSQDLAETATALRRELAETHEKHAMEFQRADKYRSELAEMRAERDDTLAAREAALLAMHAAHEERDAARKALLDTRLGTFDDGLPCWCPSPSWARLHRSHDSSTDPRAERCRRFRAIVAALGAP